MTVVSDTPSPLPETARATGGAVVGELTRAHYVQLDGLRGLAILLVMVYHFCLTLPGFQTPQVGFPLQLAQAGWMGVDLFFVLSGFLITNILIETRATQHYFRNFIARRTLRIWPLYYLNLLVFFVLLPAVLHTLPDTMRSMQDKQAWFWLYGANWLFAREAGFGRTAGGYFWSLAVEEQFYLVWPLVVYLLTNRSLLRVSVSLLALSLVLRVVLAHLGVPGNSLYVITFTHLDGLAVGSSLAVCLRDPRLTATVRRLLPFAAAVGLAGLVAARLVSRDYFFWDKGMATYGYTAIAILFGSLLVYSLDNGSAVGLNRLLSSVFMRQTGKYSYALYMAHVPIAGIVAALATRFLAPRIGTLPSFLVFVVGAFGASWLAAVLSWHLFEKRILALKRYFEYGNAATIRPSSASSRT
jgi:peptidoglycan/LPS O-acetylase OafA/YrhL